MKKLLFIHYCFIIIFLLFFKILDASEINKNAINHIIVNHEKSLKNKNRLLLDIKEKTNKLVLSINFTEKNVHDLKNTGTNNKDGMFTVLIDDNFLFQEVFTGSDLKTEKTIPLHTVSNGEHILRCEIYHGDGKYFKNEVAFLLNSAPSVIVEKEKEKTNSFNPVITLHYFDEGEEMAGHLEILVDERVVGTREIAAKENGKPFNLSQLLGNPLDVASLPPGEHLIAIRALSLNGSETMRYLPFEVETLPKLEVITKPDNMDGFKATFLQTGKGHSGSIDIFFRQGIILSRQSKTAEILITKAEVLNAFEQHKLPLPKEPFSLIVCLRSANNTENWQVVSFQP